MPELKVEVDAGEVGFEAGRLARIDRHLNRFVDDGRLPGWLALVARHGRVVHLATGGSADVEAGRPVEVDTLFRIYSMTKPITSVAAMLLYEEGAFELKDPVSRYIPSFEDVRVYRSGSALNPTTEPASEPVRIWHLLSHTSGLTYGFHHATPVDAMYRAAGFEWASPEGAAGQSPDRVFAERILDPLDMTDTTFSTPETDHPRLAALYTADPRSRK